MTLQPLPIDALLPEILASLRLHPNLILEAAPGAGKTTRVPPALLQLVAGEILVLEPRRIAARLAARRVAAEMGETAGGTVGYQVRFEDVFGPTTRLRFVTEGVFTRRMLIDPTLRGVDAVILDEFHERHLDTDLALALLKRLQRSRAELRLLVMSATLDSGPVAAFLNAPTLRSEGRMFPLTIRHLPYSANALPVQVKHAVELLRREPQPGHTLVFLPGVAEIRRTARELQSLGGTADILPLHGDLTPAEQDQAVAPSSKPKIILATNVAESSITVDGVTAVIDSGLARSASFSAWTGLPTLELGRISQASATQRAGRAGRTAAGRVLRLYPEEDLRHRPAFDTPEIQRADLVQLCLALRVLGLAHFAELDWLDAPPEAAVAHAEELLDRLGATGAMAQKLSRYPLPPRLARVLAEALARGVGEAGVLATALLSSGARPAQADLLAALDAPQDARTTQTAVQLRRIARPVKAATNDDEPLLLALLTGFPDRVARRRAGSEILLSNGRTAELTGEPPPYEFMLALDAEDRTEKPIPIVRLTSRIEPEWLLDLFPDRVREQVTLVWNEAAERVETLSELLYDALVIEQSRSHMPEPEAAAAMLTDKALEAGLARFVDVEAFENYQARAAFAGANPIEPADALRELCVGLKSFKELDTAAKSLISLLESRTPRLHELAPTTLRLPTGRTTRIHYEANKPPWIASRLQDFFGMTETPRIGPRREPVVVHLLAPNQRAVQMTTDLAGFWQRLYPEVRRELSRRYPRHQWPEKP